MPASVPVRASVGDCDRSAGRGRARRGSPPRLGEAEVEHLDLAVRRQLHVGRASGRGARCRVSCASSSASAICRATSSASSTGSGPRFSRSARSSPGDQLQHQERRAVGLLEPVDRGDVRVVERRQQLGLALEAREALGIGGDGLRQHLDRDLASEPRVAWRARPRPSRRRRAARRSRTARAASRAGAA